MTFERTFVGQGFIDKRVRRNVRRNVSGESLVRTESAQNFSGEFPPIVVSTENRSREKRSSETCVF